MPPLDVITNNATLITAIIAIYGAFLATLNFFNSRKKEKPNLIVRVEIDFIDPENLGSSPEGLKVVCINDGMKTVTIGEIIIEEIELSKNIWYKLKNRIDSHKNKRYYSSIKAEGIEIQSGKSKEYFFDPEQLNMKSDISLEQPVIAIVIDQTGNQFRSKPFHV